MSKKKQTIEDKNEVYYYFIYMHINKINNKKYVGITYLNPPKKRWRNGLGYPLKGNPHFYYAIQKYGWDNFEHIILEEGLFTLLEVSKKEEYYINYYNTLDTDYGYNIKPGGYFGISPNATKGVIKWMKEHPEVGLERAASMHKWQQEHPEEMYEMQKINVAKATEARKKKVVCIELSKVFESAREAGRSFPKVSQSKVTMCCQGQRKTAGGYHWVYLEDYKNISDIKEYLSLMNEKVSRPYKKPVICIETNEVFESVTQAANEKNLNLSSIAECCRNTKSNNYTCGGYHWRFKNE